MIRVFSASFIAFLQIGPSPHHVTIVILTSHGLFTLSCRPSSLSVTHVTKSFKSNRIIINKIINGVALTCRRFGETRHDLSSVILLDGVVSECERF